MYATALHDAYIFSYFQEYLFCSKIKLVITKLNSTNSKKTVNNK